MPVSVKKIGNKYRVVGPGGKPETKSGEPIDGGGYQSKDEAVKQMTAINMSKSGKDIVAQKNIKLMASELSDGHGVTASAHTFVIISDGTPEGTSIMAGDREVQFDSIELYCCKGEYPCCNITMTVKDIDSDGKEICRTVTLRKDKREDY